MSDSEQCFKKILAQLQWVAIKAPQLHIIFSHVKHVLRLRCDLTFSFFSRKMMPTVVIVAPRASWSYHRHSYQQKKKKKK